MWNAGQLPLLALLGLCVLALPPTGALAGAPGTVTIWKVDATTLDPLGGACFRITTASQSPVASVCDDGPGDDASSTAGLIAYDTGVPDVYHVQETQAPPGYSPDPGKYPCDATSDLLCLVQIGNTPAAVGGVAELPDVTALPLGEPRSSGDALRWFVALAAATGAVALGVAAWYLKRG